MVGDLGQIWFMISELSQLTDKMSPGASSNHCPKSIGIKFVPLSHQLVSWHDPVEMRARRRGVYEGTPPALARRCRRARRHAASVSCAIDAPGTPEGVAAPLHSAQDRTQSQACPPWTQAWPQHRLPLHILGHDHTYGLVNNVLN